MNVRGMFGMRAFLVAAVSLAALLVVAAVGADTGPQVLPPNTHGPAGVVQANGQGQNNNDNGNGQGNGAGQGNGPGPQAAGQAGTNPNNMTYHGGPVMHTNHVYLIFWSPSGSTWQSGYTSEITQYFTDVAADNGGNQNVYSIDPQYSGTNGSAQYSTTFNAATDAVTVNDGFSNSCTSVYGSRYPVTGCVTDSDIQNEVSKVMAANGWQPGLGNMYFVFTPFNIGSCYGNSTADCAYTAYCAYHSYFAGANNQPVLYANMPYSDGSGIGLGYACNSGELPNGNWADATINVTSHEHNETITDPEINAWYTGNYDEIGDLCAWNFGSALGSTTATNSVGDGSEYNQVINGHNYYMQQEWSNAQNGCSQRYTPPAPPGPPGITNVTPTTGPVGTSVTITGANFSGTTSVSFAGTSASFTVGSGGTTITTKVPSGAQSGPITVTTPYGQGSSTAFTVTPTLPSPDFTISAAPTSESISRGSTATYTATITELNGLNGSVSLSVNGLPFGAHPLFSPSSTSTTSTLTISTTRNTQRTNNRTLTITGTSGSLTHSTTVKLSIN